MEFIDLFSGCGGMSKGFELAGGNCKGFVEFWKPAIETHELNCGGELIGKDITQIKEDVIEKYKGVDVIIGGPPCQGFSLAGRRKKEDLRNRLFEEFVRFVKIIRPKYFVMENVPGIASMKNEDGTNIITEIFEAFVKEGYDVDCKVLCAENYEVPQKRRRAIFIGNRLKNKNNYPDFIDNKVFLREVLNLPYAQVEEIQHIYEKTSKKKNYMISFVEEGKNYGTFRSNYIKPRIDGFSGTITKSGRYIHPIFNRLLSIREHARIQSFPEDFRFCGTMKQKYEQIGNAVPVLMAKAIAEVIKEDLHGQS